MPSDTQFKGFSSFGDAGPSKNVKRSLIDFIDWSLLEIGAFVNVVKPASGIYGGEFTRLRLAKDESFTEGQVWQAVRTNWVWQSGISFGGGAAITSGVFVNNIFYPGSTVGAYAHSIDYPNGRVIFTSAIPTSSRVDATHSFKHVQITDTDNPWFKELLDNTLRPNSTPFTATSGAYFLLGSQRLQMPAIVMDLGGNDDLQGYQLGQGQWWRFNVIMHIFANTSDERDKLKDLLVFQREKKIRLYDLNAIANARNFSLNYNGSIASGAKTYPQLIDAYYWKDGIIKNTKSQGLVPFSPNLFACSVFWDMEVQIGNI